MKLTYLIKFRICFFIFLFATSLSAQEEKVFKWEFGLGFGHGSSTKYAFTFVPPLKYQLNIDLTQYGGVNPPERKDIKSFKAPGAANFHIAFLPNKQFNLIANLTLEKMSENRFTEEGTSYPYTPTTYFTTRQIRVLGFQAEYNWYNKSGVNVYSGLGIGMMLFKDHVEKDGAFLKTEKSSLLKRHFTLVGVKLIDEIGMIFELGYGYQGFVKVGMYYRL